MMSHLRNLRLVRLIGWSLLLTSAVVMAAESIAQSPELIVEIEKREIYEGESVLYRVTLNHVEEPTPPLLAGFDDFQVTSLGEQSLDARQVTIINGRRTEIVRRGRQYNYRLTPLRSGKITIPAPTAKLDAEVLTGSETTLQVIPPDVQDSVILEFTADRTEVYPMQPFELMVTICVKELPGKFQDRDPLSVQSQPPELEVAWLTDNQMPDGLQPEKSWREILEPLVSRRGDGVQVNNIGASSVFSLFEEKSTGFHPPPKRVTRKDASGADVGYWEYRFGRRLIPQKPGHYPFEPVTLKGTFANEINGDQLVGQRLYALAPGLQVTVKEVPLAGRPNTYVHAVGSFDLKAELVPTSASVGDPMTLTLTLAGQGTLADARPPAIGSQPGIEGAFRTYDATTELQAGRRRFTYSLRPLSADLTEFPKIAVAYFDAEAEKYVTINTDPIPITIGEAEVLDSAEIVSAPTTGAASQEKLEASEGGVFANDSNLSALRNERTRPSRWVAAWAAMLVGWVVASLSIGRVRRIREDPALLRRRAAATRAEAALVAAASQLTSDDASEPCESLRRAITGLIADYANVPEAGLTPRDAAEQLAAFGLDETLCTSTEELLNQCDAARYGTGAESASALHAQAATLVGELVTALKQSSTGKSSPQARSALGILLLLGATTCGCSAAADLKTVRQWQEAEQSFAQAASADDFARVARQYDQLSGDEFTSGAVLYNQGNALMRAGEVGRAIAAYRQAVRYRPRDPYLMANLHSALAACGRGTETTSGAKLARTFFFWQNWLSYPEKFALTTGLLALALILSLLGQLTAHQIVMHRLAVAFGIFFLVAVVSTGWDWYRFDYTMHGVVTSEQATARKGNSATYEQAFTHPLNEGSEFVVLEKRNDWLHVKVGDSGTGWLRLRDVETY